MIKDKISSQEIIDLVASKASVSKRAAEEFLRVMIASIEDALYADESVKIKNFGTFKLQWNEPRKSVNIQTGDEIMLAGYHKVSFTPDVILRDLVNEPFAHLVPVELDGENSIDLQKEESADVALDPLRVFTEQASEIKNLLSEIQALSPVQKPEPKVDVTIEEVIVKKDDPKARIEIPDYVFVDEQSDVIGNNTEKPLTTFFDVEKTEVDASIKKENEEPAQLIVGYFESKSMVQEVSKPIEESKDFESTPFLKSSTPVKKRNAWWLIVLIVVILAGGFVGLYFSNSGVRNFSDKAFANTISELVYAKDCVCNWISPKPKRAPKTETLVVPKDTASDDSLQGKEPVDSLQMLFDNPRKYNEFIATVQIKKSSRLTLISKKYYGTKDFWVYIYEANKERISNPDEISSGTLIRIPKLDPRLIDASNPRCMQKARELHDQYVKMGGS
jgi:nucleoid DNA-binding protein/nucleoid-associated protein YgaU